MEAGKIVHDLTEKIQKNANAKAVFGDPYVEGDLTVIPVARISIRGGGGGGFGKCAKKGDEEGGGMGLGVNVETVPLGYIKIKDSEAEFVEILDKTKLAIGGIFATAICFLGLLCFSEKCGGKKSSCCK